MKRLVRYVGAAFLLTASTIWAGSFEDATDAIQRGDYATAFKIIQPLAAQGDAYAQYNLGAMYLQGHEVLQDFTEAVKWFHLSAAQGVRQI
jgi:TPR repeat protein